MNENLKWRVAISTHNNVIMFTVPGGAPKYIRIVQRTKTHSPHPRPEPWAYIMLYHITKKGLGKIAHTKLQFYKNTYWCACIHTHTHTQTISITINARSTDTINIMTETVVSYSCQLQLSVTVEEMSLKRSSEGLNGTTFPGASRQCIPERWSNIPEGSLTVSLCLRSSWPRNIKERS